MREARSQERPGEVTPQGDGVEARRLERVAEDPAEARPSRRERRAEEDEIVSERLTSLADLPTPTYAERQAIFREEKAAAKARNLAASARGKREASRRPRLAVQHSSATITWIEPVRLHPDKRIMVVGVAADAADDVRAMYL